MYIMCVCFFSALSCRVGALHISILIIITKNYIFMGHSDVEDWNHLKQSIKNIVSSVREMCTVSFNCHQNVAIGMKTIPNQHKSATTEALQPRNESMLYYLNHLITDHWHVYILYIWDLTWGCDVTDTDVSEGTGSKSVCSNAVLHPIMSGLEKTTQFTKSEHKKG